MEVADLSDNKYRVHEVAKDFKINGKAVGSKKVMEILTKYGETPSSHMAVLSDKELSIIFDYLTQKNQIEDLEEELKKRIRNPRAARARARRPLPRERIKSSPQGSASPRATAAAPPSRGIREPAKKDPKTTTIAAAPPLRRALTRPQLPEPWSRRHLPPPRTAVGCPRRRWSTPAAAWT